MREILKQLVENLEENNQKAFCDKTAIKQSRLSMILNGKRNKSGDDLYKSILNAYPSINPYWLITGKGEMLIGTEHKKNQFKSYDLFDLPERVVNQQGIEYEHKTQEVKHEIKAMQIEQNEKSNSEKEIVEIILCYSDNTFKVLKNIKVNNK